MNKRKKVKCNRCGYRWVFKGNRKYSATCPDCHGNVKLKELPK